MSTPSDLYVVLEVVRTASENDIKKAFRKLARRYHPDVNPGDRTAEDHFKLISEAYEVLSDPLKRQFYDQNGFYTEGVLEQQGARTAHGTWGFSFKSFDFSGTAHSAAGEVFSRFFSRQASRREPERGQDLECQISISFADSIAGLKTRISVQRRHSCQECAGMGRTGAESSRPCATCGGDGKVARLRGRLQFMAPCDDCSGTGKVVTDCPNCGGEGRVPRTDLMELQIPAGVSAGSRIRFPGQGDAGRYGGAGGDLYLVTNVAPHPFFTRTGDNVQCLLPVTFSEAALGAKIEVPTVDGKTVVRIPPGTQNGQTFRLRGKGAPSLMQPGMRGDQFVQIHVSVPRIGDERSKEILREFALLNSENPRKHIWPSGNV